MVALNRFVTTVYPNLNVSQCKTISEARQPIDKIG